MKGGAEGEEMEVFACDCVKKKKRLFVSVKAHTFATRFRELYLYVLYMKELRGRSPKILKESRGK